MLDKLPVRYAIRIIFWSVHLVGLVLLSLGVWRYYYYCEIEPIWNAIVASIALLAIFHNSKINTRRATIEIVLKMLADKDLIKDQNLMRGVEIDTDKIANIVACPPTKNEENAGDIEIADALMRTLNYYEFLAAGVRNRAIDYRMIHETEYTTITRYWKKYSSLINKLRDISGSKTIFQELECLAAEFEDHKLTRRR